MIIGTGMIAKCFLDYDNKDVIIFASGVSNSSEDRIEEFKREEKLIKETYEIHSNKLFIYFSSVNLYEDKEYFKHKRNMELIIQSFNNFLIFRLPQLVGYGGNNNNLFNFFKEKIINNETIYVKKSFRSLLDIQDLYKVVTLAVENQLKNKTITISYIEYLETIDIINLIYEEFNKKPKIKKLNSIEGYIIKNCLISEQLIKSIGLVTKGYTKKIIQKYL